MRSKNSRPSSIIATYNIELSKKDDAIIDNIRSMAAKGTGIFCLQEVLRHDGKPFIIDALLKTLGKSWDALYFIGDEPNFRALGVAIIWNKDLFTLVDSDTFILPQLQRLSFYEVIIAALCGFSGGPVKRRAMTAVFTFAKKKIRISSIHVDVCGGNKQKIKQVSHLLDRLQSKELVDHEIIAGDFNTTGGIQSAALKKTLQHLFNYYGFMEATADIPWTQDLYHARMGKENL